MRAFAAGVAFALAATALAGSLPPRACSRPPGHELSSRGFVEATLRNTPSVVSVVVLRARRGVLEDAGGLDFFQGVSGLPLGEDASAALERSISSGFVISSDGYVLSTAHGVMDAREAWVITTDGRRHRAAVVGWDRGSDVALLKVDATGLIPAPVQMSGGVCPGEWVAAMGSPFGFEHSLTVGVVSAYPRFLAGGGGMPLIQSDTVLNPGSSGGPLFNADGLVVGMNSMIFSASGIYIGVSFSLPIDRVMRIAAGIRAGLPRGHIGIRTQPVTPDLGQAFGLARPGGALVTGVTRGGTAEEAGIRNGDILLAIDDKAFESQMELEELIGRARPGALLVLNVWRQRSWQRVTVKVAGASAEPPRALAAAPAGDAARLGLTLAPATVSKGMPSGVYVESASGAGLLAGIEPGDRITAINGVHVADSADFDAALEAAGANNVVALLVTRGSTSIYIAVSRRAR